LLAAEPDNAVHQRELAFSRFGLGVLYCTSNRADEAEPVLIEARALYEKALRKEPHDLECQTRLASAHNSQGVLYMNTGAPKKAETAFREALTIKERLAKEHPAVLKYQEDLANSYTNLGIHYLGTRRLAESVAMQQKALAIKEKLLARNPGDLQLAVNLAGSCCNLGVALRHQQKPAESLPCFGKAVKGLQEVLKREPLHGRAREFLCKSYGGRAEALETLKRHAEAMADWDQALTNCHEEERPSLRLRRALALARVGKYAEAEREAEEIARLGELPGVALYNLACVHALCAGDKERAEKQTGRALDLLRRAEVAGYFRAAARREHLRTDGDFDALRSRKEFAEFLQKAAGDGGEEPR
jgi:tetratricopeptide (TPR) repeat protein